MNRVAVSRNDMEIPSRIVGTSVGGMRLLASLATGVGYPNALYSRDCQDPLQLLNLATRTPSGRSSELNCSIALKDYFFLN